MAHFKEVGKPTDLIIRLSDLIIWSDFSGKKTKADQILLVRLWVTYLKKLNRLPAKAQVVVHGVGSRTAGTHGKDNCGSTGDNVTTGPDTFFWMFFR